MFVHCCAHRLNLVLSQGPKCLSETGIFTASPSGFKKRMSPFFQSAGSSKDMPRNAPTRRSSTSRIVRTVVNNYAGILQTFDKITQDESMDDDTVDAAKGFRLKLENFEFVFVLYTYEEIFGGGCCLWCCPAKRYGCSLLSLLALNR